MAKFKALGAVAVLSVVLGSAVSAQQATKSSGHPTTGTVGADTAVPKGNAGDAQHRKSGVPGRPGISCQRDTYFTGEDGQRHLCK